MAQGFDVRALDPSAATIEKLIAEGIAGKVGSIASMPYDDGQFDAVFCSEVLEHLDDDSLGPGLAEVARVLAPGGYLIGTVPFREDLAAAMVVCPDCGKVFHRWGHHRAFDKDSLRAALTGGGLQMVLFQVDARDPAIFAGITLVLAITGMVACLLPANRASRIDPVIALRNQ